MQTIDRRRCLQWLGAVTALTPQLPWAQSRSHENNFWTLARQGGCVMLMRHAQTVAGIGDPPEFRLGDCSTQRNLSPAGRAFSSALGLRFAQERVQLQSVWSSAWCRCVDTARLAFDPHHPAHQVWPALNSFFQGQGDERSQTREVIGRVRQQAPGYNWMLVTHQVNISALTGQGTHMGEVLLCRLLPGQAQRLTVLASLPA